MSVHVVRRVSRATEAQEGPELRKRDSAREAPNRIVQMMLAGAQLIPTGLRFE